MTPSTQIEDVAVSVERVAHDLNNLCTSMLGFAELALDSLSPAVREYGYLQEIAESGRNTMPLAERLRDIAAALRGLQAGK
jgi:signal transduction histidine kinase